jgi:hypothetical protein
LRSAIRMFLTIDRASLAAMAQQGTSDGTAGSGERSSSRAMRLRQPGYLGSRPVALRPRLTTGVLVRFAEVRPVGGAHGPIVRSVWHRFPAPRRRLGRSAWSMPHLMDGRCEVPEPCRCAATPAIPTMVTRRAPTHHARPPSWCPGAPSQPPRTAPQ